MSQQPLPPGHWQCVKCTYINTKSLANVCEICGSIRLHSQGSAQQGQHSSNLRGSHSSTVSPPHRSGTQLCKSPQSNRNAGREAPTQLGIRRVQSAGEAEATSGRGARSPFNMADASTRTQLSSASSPRGRPATAGPGSRMSNAVPNRDGGTSPSTRVRPSTSLPIGSTTSRVSMSTSQHRRPRYAEMRAFAAQMGVAAPSPVRNSMSGNISSSLSNRSANKSTNVAMSQRSVSPSSSRMSASPAGHASPSGPLSTGVHKSKSTETIPPEWTVIQRPRRKSSVTASLSAAAEAALAAAEDAGFKMPSKRAAEWPNIYLDGVKLKLTNAESTEYPGEIVKRGMLRVWDSNTKPDKAKSRDVFLGTRSLLVCKYKGDSVYNLKLILRPGAGSSVFKPKAVTNEQVKTKYRAIVPHCFMLADREYNEFFFAVNSASEEKEWITALKTCDSPDADNKTDKPKDPPKPIEWKIPRSSIALDSELWGSAHSSFFTGIVDGGRRCTVKEFKASKDKSEIGKEIAILKKLSQPNIVKMYSFVEDERMPHWIVMERFEATLGMYLRLKKNSISIDHLLAMMRHVLTALVYMDRRQLVHGDIRAENVVVDSRLVCKLINFEYSVDLDGQATQVNDDIIPSAYQWAAPEVLQEKKFSVKSDIWSWGVLVWEMFALGGVPWIGKTQVDMLHDISDGIRLPSASDFMDIPEYLFDHLLQCWNIQPNRRPTAISLDEALQQLYGDIPTLFDPEGVHYTGVDASNPDDIKLVAQENTPISSSGTQTDNFKMDHSPVYLTGEAESEIKHEQDCGDVIAPVYVTTNGSPKGTDRTCKGAVGSMNTYEAVVDTGTSLKDIASSTNVSSSAGMQTQEGPVYVTHEPVESSVDTTSQAANLANNSCVQESIQPHVSDVHTVEPVYVTCEPQSLSNTPSPTASIEPVYVTSEEYNDLDGLCAEATNKESQELEDSDQDDC